VLREYLRDEDFCNIDCGNVVCRRNEDSFLGKAVNNYQNGGEAVRWRELLNEIHANRSAMVVQVSGEVAIGRMVDVWRVCCMRRGRIARRIVLQSVRMLGHMVIAS
jgi:hypothetical protein